MAALLIVEPFRLTLVGAAYDTSLVRLASSPEKQTAATAERAA